MTQTLKNKIAILDFGSQYTQLIARRIRECNVYSEIFPFNASVRTILNFSPDGIIFSGSPFSVYDPNSPLPSEEFLHLDIPVLGICYGMQVITHLLKGEVDRATKREYGRAELFIDDDSDLFSEINESKKLLIVWMSHGDRIIKPPPDFVSIGHTFNSPIAAFRHIERKIFGVQFHPEVIHTPEGKDILKNFLFKVCNCSPTWTMASFIDNSIKEIREMVGEGKVICALSGGVDSSVVAVLVNKAIGDSLTCIFVDNGLLRKNEGITVKKTFEENFHINLRYIDASERFLSKLSGVVDPEEKRKIIGAEFISVFQEEASKIGNVDFLAQGTLYPDVIESVSFRGPSATIKTHHNVGGLPSFMNFKLIEPLRELFKDEVRILGRVLDIPDRILMRQPFPGPGLAIRIIGSVTEERLNILKEADFIVQEEILNAGLYENLWQSFAILLPVKTVGVMGDERTYAHVIALRAVESMDGMTADWARLDYNLLGRISNRIINEVRGVNRVVYDISSKPPGTIEWE